MTAPADPAPTNSDIYAPDVLADPYAFYGRLRESDPVHWSEQYQTWLVTRHEDVLWLVRHPELFSSEIFQRDPSPLPPIDEADRADLEFINTFRGQQFIHTDPPEHTRMRQVLRSYFSARGMELWRQTVQDAVRRLLDAAQAGGSMDIVTDVARPLPLLVISEMMGIPQADRAMLKRQADERMLSALGLEPDRMRRGAAGIRESSEYLQTQIELRLAEPADDLLQVLAEAQRSSQYSRAETLANAQTLIDAGHETTIQLIGNGMLAFLRHRDQWDLLRTDPRGLAAAATEECLRYDAPIPSLRRIAARDVELRGRQIKAGDRVSWVIAAANRDPRVYADPDRFDITRSASQHLAFGFGAHYCLGQFLGRIEGQEVFIAMAARFPALRLATDSLDYARVRGIRRLNSLPVTW